MARALPLGLILLAVAGCHTITEELPPAQNTSGPTPIIVNPPPGNSVLIIPGASPAPPTQPPVTQPPQGGGGSPQPTPTPKPPSNPPSQPNMHAASEVYVSVTSFLRDGRLVKGRAQHYQPGDVIYLTCTPKDSDHQPTRNHGPIQGWNIRSGNLGGGDYYYTDTHTFNPDIHVSPNSASGSVEADCRVDDIKSNTLSMPIHP
jgi:hypothetical protein